MTTSGLRDGTRPAYIDRLLAVVNEQHRRELEAPGRAAILRAVQRAFNGEELSIADFDAADPAVAAVFGAAFRDVVEELGEGANGRIARAAAAMLADARRRGVAPR